MRAIKVTIETPKGSRQKFDFDLETRSFTLKKILPIGMSFPYDFGFIPGTKGEDGDPLDVIIISDHAMFPGCSALVRIIGCISAIQSKDEGSSEMIKNDRFVAVLDEDKLYDKANDIRDIPATALGQLQEFFVQYNKLEGKKFKVNKILNAARAAKAIKDNKAH